MSYKVNKHPLYMSRTALKIAIFFAALVVGAGCAPQERKTSRAFYFWKSALKADSTEQQALRRHQVKDLYVKFFDVTWNTQLEKPEPAAKILIDSASKAFFKKENINLIPTVFITNETLENIIPDAVNKLGERIYYLLSGLLDENDLLNIKEVQFDCDWTESTRDKYFELLRYMKMLPKLADKKMSVTIRLYQCKYKDKAGIPPANRGLLMCYNMGNLKNPQTKNSILETTELQQYIGNLNDYPLPLDIALPLFDWTVLFRQGQYTGLISNLPSSFLDSNLCKTDGNYKEMQVDTLLNGYELKKGDRLREEKSSYEEIMKAAAALKPQLITPEFKVVLYHLDATVLKKYSTDELEKIYSSLH